MRINLVLRKKDLADIITFFDIIEKNKQYSENIMAALDGREQAIDDLIGQLERIKKVDDLHTSSQKIIKKVDRSLKNEK